MRLTLDEDLAAMYLTDKKNGMPRRLSDHEDLEVLLESFSKQVEEIVNEAENIQVSNYACCRTRRRLTRCCCRLQSNVQSTQEIVELVLDSNRNELLALDLKVRPHRLVTYVIAQNFIDIYMDYGNRYGHTSSRSIWHECTCPPVLRITLAVLTKRPNNS